MHFQSGISLEGTPTVGGAASVRFLSVGKKNGLRFQSGIRQVEKSRAVLEEEEARDFLSGVSLAGGLLPPGPRSM